MIAPPYRGMILIASIAPASMSQAILSVVFWQLIETAGSVLLNNQVDQLVAAMASYDVPAGVGNVIPQDVQDSLQPILAENWQTIV
ncbi:MAG: hypothetical protein KZQ81_17605 [Candidatus Thiodiazotropha sp. (ex Rostrolucina anterorostrata)]|nr:hypothetical protein [Candidatus Thiodiazotropha sp. (ex Rostrolucina anterorostrata)]